jgi:hypothetical protein
VFVAVVYTYLAFVFVRYPGIAVMLTVMLIVGIPVRIVSGEPVLLSDLALYPVLALMSLMLAVGPRMLIAMIWQMLRVVVALGKMFTVIALFMFVMSIVAAPFAAPLAAVTLGSLIGAVWLGALVHHVCTSLVLPSLDARTGRFLNSLSLPAFDWRQTPYGRLEAIALQRRARKQEQKSRISAES